MVPLEPRYGTNLNRPISYPGIVLLQPVPPRYRSSAIAVRARSFRMTAWSDCRRGRIFSKQRVL